MLTQWSTPRLLRGWLFPKAPAGRLLEDGDVLPVLGGLRVIHTPGHTPGSMCLLLERHQALFVGDMLLSNGKRLSRSLFFPGSNAQDYRQSLHRLAALEFQAVLQGHGPPCLQEGP
ncbi:MAG: MBL fold metallo-hydrolase [Dehalococcoidia bacterium]|nr:MBL fold metallo-hydrolase [Dehalococcoidia bacterium]